MTLGWKELEAKGSGGKGRCSTSDRKAGGLAPTDKLSPAVSSAAPPAHRQGVPATQLQRKMRDGTRKESGGHPKKVGMRTRDRDRSETHTCKAASKGCRDASESRSDSLFSLVQTAPPAPRGFSHHWKLATARQSVAWAICPCQAETLLQAALTVVSVRAGDKSPFPRMRSEMRGHSTHGSPNQRMEA